jgi:hypothetical protein
VKRHAANPFAAIRRYLSKRCGWQFYTKRVLAQRRLWDILYDSRIESVLQAGCLYSHVSPPALENDPILADPRMIAGSWYMDVFTRPTREYVYRLRHPVLLEPKYGYAIAQPRSLLDVSLPRSETTRAGKSMLDFSGLPALSETLFRRGRHSVIREPSVISLRYSHEQNYYHVIQDMLSRLRMLDEHGVDRSLPIVISRATAETSFFREMRRQSGLAERNWLVQDDFYIACSEIYLARTSEGNRERLDYLADLLEAPEPDRAAKRRIFITRDADRHGRGIQNMEALRPVLARHGFETVTPERLPLSEQMRLFSQTGFLIGAHGAGLINMMFRRDAPLQVLELFSPLETPLHFYIIAKAYGFDYEFLVGHSANDHNRTASFDVCPEELDARIASLIRTQ